MALENSNAAAICSHIAAKTYNLPILYDNIEDSADNFTRFLIIANDIKNEKSGKDKTSWIKVVAFKKLAEIVEKYLHKGARIGIVGTLDQQKWETDEGVQRSTFQLIANSIEFIKTDGRGFEEGQENDGTPF